MGPDMLNKHMGISQTDLKVLPEEKVVILLSSLSGKTTKKERLFHRRKRETSN